jgi:hypothetical protein
VSHFTIDKGETWSACSGLPEGILVAADGVNPLRFYAFDPVAGKLLFSTNGAVRFESAEFKFAAAPATGSGPGFDVTRRAKLSATPGAEGDLWLAFGGNGLWHSTNGGAGFMRLENVDGAMALGFGLSTEKTYPMLFLFGTIGGQQGIFHSGDTGKTWSRINDDDHQFGWIDKIAGDPRITGRVYLATSGRGIIYGDPVSSSK